MNFINLWNKKIACKCAELCIGTYEHTFPIQDFMLLQDLPSTMGFVLQEKSTNDIYICIRGTHKLEDFFADAECLQQRTEFGWVHHGFYKDFTKILPSILETFARLENKEYNVYVTGHSLGAAVCVLTVFSLKKYLETNTCNFKAKIFAYPIALPRVGDITFRDNYLLADIPTFPIANTHDLVPRSPVKLNYTQLLDFIYVNFHFHNKIKDHEIKNYYENILLLGETL